jgi:glycosyltransferase involved in cell wall biosynthesis
MGTCAVPSAAEPLRILHVAAPATVGGLERVLGSLAIGMAQRGHDVHVAALVHPKGPTSPLLSLLRSAGVEVHEHPVTRFGAWREIHLMRALCEKLAPDVVHTHGYRADIVDSAVARWLGIPTLSTEHGMSKMGGMTTLYEWLQLRSLRRFDSIIAVSTPIATTLQRAGVDPRRIHRLPNAWPADVEFALRDEARRELGLPLEARVIGFIGRLIRAKGADVLLTALSHLGGAAPLTVVIGDGPEGANLRALCEQLGLRERVRWLGELPRAARWIPAFDAFVLPSRTEGTPIVLLEAMAAGIPIVATRVGGVPDVLDGGAGLLVDSEDALGFAQALERVLTEERLAGASVHRARRRLEAQHCLAAWLGAHERVYSELCESASPKRSAR